MDIAPAFSVNPNAIHEEMDGEVVVVNMDTGNYYSLSKVGATVWNMIGERATTDDILNALCERYSGDPEDIRRTTGAFLEKLQAEQLIAASEVEKAGAVSAGQEVQAAGEKQPFEEPALERYSDMQELLLLDPIHDVDESGWPNRPPDDAKA